MAKSHNPSTLDILYRWEDTMITVDLSIFILFLSVNLHSQSLTNPILTTKTTRHLVLSKQKNTKFLLIPHPHPPSPPAPQELVELWPSVATQLSERLATQLSVLQQRMASACAAASAEDQEAKLKAGRPWVKRCFQQFEWKMPGISHRFAEQPIVGK